MLAMIGHLFNVYSECARFELTSNKKVHVNFGSCWQIIYDKTPHDP